MPNAVRPRVFVARLIPDAGLDLVTEFCNADVWQDELPPPPATLAERVRGVEGILSLLTDRIDGAVLAAAGPQLRVISNFAVGFDNIDLAAATAARIPVGNTPDVLTEATADFAFTLLLAAARRLCEGVRYAQAGRWRTWGPRLLLGQDVSGATLGIIGFGRIGKEMARRAQGFSMRVLYYDPACPDDPAAASLDAACTDLDTLLAESDFVSIHTPLLPATRHLIDAAALRKMKPTAVLINTARGPIVDHDALTAALQEGVIGYTALDVTEPEPLPADHPLYTLENVIIAPHMASATVATRDKMARMAAENLIAGLRGERLPHCVNPQVYA